MDWLVEAGQHVTAGQPLFQVETDKATVEVEAFREGFVRKLLVQAGDTLPVGAVVALLADSMEDPLPELLSEEDLPKPEALPVPEPATLPGDGPDRLLVTPIARRMAAAEDLDLKKITGSGPQGQILKRDIAEALAGAQSEKSLDPAVHRTPAPKMRQAIARRVGHSKNVIPHFYADITVDMTESLALLQEAAEKNELVRPSITDLCLKATALTLADYPMLNASFQEDEILYYQEINLGLVVALEEGGMLVPVIHRAHRLDLFSLAAAARRLKERSLQGNLSETDLSGGTFTVSNLGMFGLDSFTAVINPPQAAILALGAVRQQPAVVDGVIMPRPLMKGTISVDHRLVDGVDAARFLSSWKGLLEEPRPLLPEPAEESSK